MNKYNLKCYEKTYNDPLFWDGIRLSQKKDQQQKWNDCRRLTDQFYDELIYRGYLIPRAKS